MNEKDPNCPVGRDCYGIDLDNSNENAIKNDLLDQFNVNTNIIENKNINEQDQNQEYDLQNIMQGNINAEDLRKMLIEAGMDKKMLDQISDEDLLKSYQEIL